MPSPLKDLKLNDFRPLAVTIFMRTQLNRGLAEGAFQTSARVGHSHNEMWTNISSEKKWITFVRIFTIIGGDICCVPFKQWTVFGWHFIILTGIVTRTNSSADKKSEINGWMGNRQAYLLSWCGINVYTYIIMLEEWKRHALYEHLFQFSVFQILMATWFDLFVRHRACNEKDGSFSERRPLALFRLPIW